MFHRQAGVSRTEHFPSRVDALVLELPKIQLKEDSLISAGSRMKLTLFMTPRHLGPDEGIYFEDLAQKRCPGNRCASGWIVSASLTRFAPRLRRRSSRRLCVTQASAFLARVKLTRPARPSVDLRTFDPQARRMQARLTFSTSLRCRESECPDTCGRQGACARFRFV